MDSESGARSKNLRLGFLLGQCHDPVQEKITAAVVVVWPLSHVQPFRNPVDCSPPGSSVHAISQARILEEIAISFSRDLPNPGVEPTSPALAGGFLTT